MDLSRELNNDIKKINHYYEQAKDKSRVLGAASLIWDFAYLQKLNINIPKRLQRQIMQNDKNNLIKYKEFISNYDNNYELNYNFAKMGNLIDNEYCFDKPTKYKSKLSIDDSLMLVSNFFKYYDKELLDCFDDLYFNNRVYFLKKNMQEYEGITIEKNSLTDPYIFVLRKNNLKLPIILAHETIHAYLSNILLNISEKERKTLRDNNMEEVYSSFIELVFVNYLDSINYNYHDVQNYIDSYNNIMLESLNDYYQLLNDNKTKFMLKRNIYDYIEQEKYSYGRVVAYHFFRNYLINKSNTNDNILQFMIDSKEYTKNHLLNNYGLSIEKITDKKRLVKYMNFDD